MNSVRFLMTALASACLFTACGGGGNDSSAPAFTPVPTAQAAPASVRLEGCVLDGLGQPVIARVQASDEDGGAMLASTLSRADGVFTLSLPSQHDVRLATDTPGAASYPLRVGSTSLSLSACLRNAAD